MPEIRQMRIKLINIKLKNLNNKPSIVHNNYDDITNTIITVGTYK